MLINCITQEGCSKWEVIQVGNISCTTRSDEYAFNLAPQFPSKLEIRMHPGTHTYPIQRWDLARDPVDIASRPSGNISNTVCIHLIAFAHYNWKAMSTNALVRDCTKAHTTPVRHTEARDSDESTNPVCKAYPWKSFSSQKKAKANRCWLLSNPLTSARKPKPHLLYSFSNHHVKCTAHQLWPCGGQTARLPTSQRSDIPLVCPYEFFANPRRPFRN